MPFFPRDLKLQTNIVRRLEEAEKCVKQEQKLRSEGEKDVRAHVDAECAQLRVYMDESTDTVRTLVGNEQEKLRARIQVQESVLRRYKDLSSFLCITSPLLYCRRPATL